MIINCFFFFFFYFHILRYRSRLLSWLSILICNERSTRNWTIISPFTIVFLRPHSNHFNIQHANNNLHINNIERIAFNPSIAQQKAMYQVYISLFCRSNMMRVRLCLSGFTTIVIFINIDIQFFVCLYFCCCFIVTTYALRHWLRCCLTIVFSRLT